MLNDVNYTFGVERWDVTEIATLNDLYETGDTVTVSNGRVYLSYTTTEV